MLDGSVGSAATLKSTAAGSSNCKAKGKVLELTFRLDKSKSLTVMARRLVTGFDNAVDTSSEKRRSGACRLISDVRPTGGLLRKKPWARLSAILLIFRTVPTKRLKFITKLPDGIS